MKTLLLYGFIVLLAGCTQDAPTQGSATTAETANREQARSSTRVQHVTRIKAPSQVVSLAYSSDGKLIASGHLFKPASIWDAKSRKRKRDVGPGRSVRCLVFSPDNTKIAVSGWSGSKNGIAIYDVPTGELVTEFGDDYGIGTYLAFSPDGKRLASSDGGYIRVWNVETGTAEVSVGGSCPVFMPGGRRIACGGSKSGLKSNKWGVTILDAFSGEILNVMAGHPRPVKSLALSHDGKRIASVGSDSTIKVWDVEAGKELVSTRYRKPCNDEYIRFSPDGKLLVTVCGAELVIWDSETGTERKTLDGQPRGFLLSAAEFSPDGTTLAAASTANLLLFWEMDSLRTQ